jgi:hypothetical protein
MTTVSTKCPTLNIWQSKNNPFPIPDLEVLVKTDDSTDEILSVCCDYFDEKSKECTSTKLKCFYATGFKKI